MGFDHFLRNSTIFSDSTSLFRIRSVSAGFDQFLRTPSESSALPGRRPAPLPHRVPGPTGRRRRAGVQRAGRGPAETGYRYCNVLASLLWRLVFAKAFTNSSGQCRPGLLQFLLGLADHSPQSPAPTTQPAAKYRKLWGKEMCRNLLENGQRILTCIFEGRATHVYGFFFQFKCLLLPGHHDQRRPQKKLKFRADF